MKSRIQQLFDRKMTRKGFIKGGFLLFVSSFAIYGVIEQLLSNAATPSGSTEADKGTRTGSATVVANSAFADGNAVKFGTVPSTSTTGTGSSTTTTTTSTTSPVPSAPASMGVADYKLVFHDEFDTSTLNTEVWGIVNGVTDNGTPMKSSNVALGANGLELTNTGSSGALVTSGTWFGGQSGAGFTCNPSGGGTLDSSGPIYVEFQSYVPADPQNSSLIAYWPALWMCDENYSTGYGEIDVMEGLSGTNAGDVHYGDDNSGDVRMNYNSAQNGPGTHTYGLLWTTEGETVMIDGVVQPNSASVTTATMADGPQCILLEEGGQSPGSGTVVMTVRYVRVWQG
jgi:hypothetical protein